MNNPLSHAPEATAAELRGRCGECSHVWVVAQLPMGLREVAALAGRASCPKCACTKVFVDGYAATLGGVAQRNVVS